MAGLFKILAALIAAALLIWLLLGGDALASDPIILDGEFSDWTGEANVVDALGDGGENRYDITQFWWADNSDEEYIYWRLDRGEDDKEVTYVLYVDTNNNGNFTDNGDRDIVVEYQPIGQASRVEVTVRDSLTQDDISESGNEDWGLSNAEGGQSVELRTSFSDLGMVAHQTIRVYAESFGRDGPEDQLRDRVPDTGDIQWSPVNIMGYAMLGVFVPLGGVVIWWRKGRYIWQ